MEVKLNPFWSIQNKKNWWYPVATALFFLLAIAAVVFGGEEYTLLISVAVLLLVTNVVVLLVRNPHAMVVDVCGISYCQSHFIRYKHSSKNYKPIRTEMTVTRIDSVELHQNALERLFHTGHVRIKGHTEIVFLNDYSHYYQERVEVPDVHVLYGIKDFESLCNKIYDYVDPSVVQIYKS